MKYRDLLLAFFFLFAFARPAQAEYRVFVLRIAKRAPASAPGTPAAAPTEGQDSRLVKSTLDPEQYRAFYPVAPDESITYIETWRCYGRTGNFQDFCPNPKAQKAAEPAPAT